MNNVIHPIEPEELMAYLDGELSTERSAMAAAHLSECAECAGVVADLRGISASLNTWNVKQFDSEIPHSIARALDRARSETRKRRANRWTWWRFVAQRWATVALAVLAIAVYFGTIGLKRRNLFEIQTFSREHTGTAAQSPRSKQTVELIAPDQERLGSSQTSGGGGGGDRIRLGEEKTAPAIGPMIIRTAQIALITKDFDNVRPTVEVILKRHRGYVAELKVGGSAGSGRTLTATLRVPADQLDASLTDLKALGRVESESQSGQDVTSQYVDLQARLANARNTEQRLTDLLRQRTGKLSDVLEVEQEVDRVRGEIEQMEAERKTMSNQVSFASLNATITEDYKAQLQVVPPSTSTRLSNAAVAGYKSMVDGLVSLTLFLLENVPSLLLWGAILFLPARLVWKKMRRSFAA